jgi:hypothetical protein
MGHTRLSLGGNADYDIEEEPSFRRYRISGGRVTGVSTA